MILNIILGMTSLAVIAQSDETTAPSFGDDEAVVTGTIEYMDYEFMDGTDFDYFVVLDDPIDIGGNAAAWDPIEKAGLPAVKRVQISAPTSNTGTFYEVLQAKKDLHTQRARVTGELKLTGMYDSGPLVRILATDIAPAP